jgi:hypothetical protein
MTTVRTGLLGAVVSTRLLSCICEGAVGILFVDRPALMFFCITGVSSLFLLQNLVFRTADHCRLTNPVGLFGVCSEWCRYS